MKIFNKIKQRLGELKFWSRFPNFVDIFTRSISSKYGFVGLYDLPTGPVIVDRFASDPNGIWACLYWWEYEACLKAIEPIIQNKVSVLDCGANIGGFGLLLAGRGVDIQEYHAVEMNPRTCGRLAFNLTNWRGLAPAKVMNAAVSNHSGTVAISDVFGSDSQSLFQSQNPSTAMVKIPTTTINELLERAKWESGGPDLVKIDIEGAEFEAIPLLGSDSLLNTKVVIIEIHSNRDKPSSLLVEHMQGLDFRCASRPQGEWGVYTFLRRE